MSEDQDKEYNDIEGKIYNKRNEIKSLEFRIKAHKDAIVKREKELATKLRVLERLTVKKVRLAKNMNIII